MALHGKAAMVLSFDVSPDAITEHDNWHTHEHVPERLSIPEFLRGSRWVSLSGNPRYFVLYEVEELSTLTSPAYLERLNNPTPWTAKMMTHYRRMTRGFCKITCSCGLGMGQVCLLIRLKPAPGKDAALRKWLVEEKLPGLPSKPGMASAHLLEAALTPQITTEQRIRGKDAPVDWVLFVTGYSPESVALVSETDLSEEKLMRHGAAGLASGVYRMEYSLTEREIAMRNAPAGPRIK